MDDEGAPVEFCFRETGSSPLIVYATAFGGIVGKEIFLWNFGQTGIVGCHPLSLSDLSHTSCACALMTYSMASAHVILK